MRQFKVLVIIVVFVLAAAGGEKSNRPKPIALDKIDGGDLFALDGSGAVLRLRVSEQGLAKADSFRLPLLASPSDLVSAKLFGQPVLLITSNNQNGGYLSAYSLEGKPQRQWTFRSPVVGLDVDPKSHIVYIAAYDTPDIYRLNLSDIGTEAKQQSAQEGPVILSAVLGARHLGPLLVDVSRNCLYAADLGSGRVFKFDISTRKARVIADGLSSPLALLLSADSNLLYIADGPRKRIYTLDLRGGKATKQVFSEDAHFLDLSGLARLEDGRVVVADDQRGAIFVLSKAGKIQSVLQL